MPQGSGLIVICLLGLVFLLLAMQRYFSKHPGNPLASAKYWLYIGVAFLGIVVIFSLLPIDSSAKNSVFGLLGLVVTAVIAISSTSFVSNAMAGVMLRIIRNFKPGDFIEVEQHFGRVSEMGLLHTEIQTKQRNLTTLPNLFLVTHAVTVIPEDKALIDASLSLGYDVSHHQVESILKTAGEKIGLTDTFVQVTELGNFSISYRTAGFIHAPKLLLSARSNLRKQIIDSLHAAGIEIVSPTFMNQRQFGSDETFISEVRAYQEWQNRRTEKSKVFDKADAAETLARLKTRLSHLDESIKTSKDEQQKTALEVQKAQLEEQLSQLSQQLESLEKASNTHDDAI